MCDLTFMWDEIFFLYELIFDQSGCVTAIHRRRNRGSRGGGEISPPDLYEGEHRSPIY